MQLIITGLLTDYQNRILLQKVSEESLALIGRSPEPGALPAQLLDRAFREATGLIVMPVRLASVYFSRQDDRLTFCFRCTMRGGDLKIPENGRPAGFFDSIPLPRGLSSAYRQQIDDALHHAGGPPLLEKEKRGLGPWLGRLVGHASSTPGSADWDILVQVSKDVDDGPFEWVIGEPTAGQVVTPGAGEAPWEAAARLLGVSSAARLIRVVAAVDRPAMTLIFAPKT